MTWRTWLPQTARNRNTSRVRAAAPTSLFRRMNPRNKPACDVSVGRSRRIRQCAHDEARIHPTPRDHAPALSRTGRPLRRRVTTPLDTKLSARPATAGNGALKGYVPRRNAVVVERLVAAGAIPFCMTTLPDMTVDDGLMHQASAHSDSFGAVRNPYDPTRISGGSSGGSGAILAARIVPAALGADANGSIRCPAAFCGVTGLRPSTFTIENALRRTNRKRYSEEGLLPPPLGRLYTIGPMARTAVDIAFLDTLITGESVPSVDLRAVRIAVPRPDYWERDVVNPAVAAVIQRAFAKLRDAGCRLVEIDFHGEVRSIVGTFDNPTPAAVIAEEGLNARISWLDTMAQGLREHAPAVTLEMIYRGRPMGEPSSSTLPPVDE
jgi:Asp-tRNA(Asn)/Glu-tRNA(Gln) amidotransferase A subunit family amidase